MPLTVYFCGSDVAADARSIFKTLHFGKRLLFVAVVAGFVCLRPAGAAASGAQRLGPVFGPVERIEYIKPPAYFDFIKDVDWYPHLVTPGRGITNVLCERQAGGLVMKVREEIMPRAKPPGGVWFTLFRPIHGQGHPGWGRMEPSPVCFGTIRPVPMLPGEHFLAAEHRTWGANKLTYAYTRPVLGGDEEAADFSITVSRLTPGILLESSSEMVVFFSSAPRMPRHLAWPEAGKVRLYSIPEGEALAFSQGHWEEMARKDMLAGDEYNEVPLAKPAWVLVWFGENGSYFCASRDSLWLHDFFYVAAGGEGHPIGIEAILKERGSTAQADHPFLLVFEHGPVSFCVVEGGGIRFTFGDEAGRMVLHPLFGEDLPAAGILQGWSAGLTESTYSWRERLPDAVREKCDWWEKRLRWFPVDVEEHAAYDRAADELRLVYRFKYEEVGEGGIKFAPAPPMLALAAKMGFPAQMQGAVPAGYFTQVGPYIGAENTDELKIVITGIGKYASQVRAPASGGCAEAQRLESRLAREIAGILAAGRLAPGLYHARMDVLSQFGAAPSFVWDRPGAMLSCLSAAFDFLPEEMRMPVLEYMRQEQASRPAEHTLAAPIRDGARREPYRLDTRMPRSHQSLAGTAGYDDDIIAFAEHLAQQNDRYLKEKLVPPDALYGLAEYFRRVPAAESDWSAARAAMDAYDARRDWATLGFVKRDPSGIGGLTVWWPMKQGGGRDGTVFAFANAYFAGCIGFARLAPIFEADEGVAEAYGRFCLAAAYRFALENYTAWLYAEALLRFSPKFKPDSLARTYSERPWRSWSDFIMDFNPRTDARQISELDEMHVAVSRSSAPLAGEAVPELGRFLNDLAGERIRVRLNAVYTPADWFVWNAGGYNDKKNLGNARYFFEAWIQAATARELTAWVGAPWARVGDIYYIQRVVEALYACRGAEWREWPKK